MDPVQENNIIQQAGNDILAEPERFPAVNINVSGLRWLPVRNFEDNKVDMKLTLVIPEEEVAIEGFGIELSCHILNQPVEGVYSLQNPCRIRKISTLVVEEEKERLRTTANENFILEGLEDRNEFSIVDDNAGETYFLMGYHVPNRATRTVVRVDRGDGHPHESEAFEFYIEATGDVIIIAIEDRSYGVGRQLKSAIYGEVRLCALLDPFQQDGTGGMVFSQREPHAFVAVKMARMSMCEIGDHRGVHFLPDRLENPIQECMAMLFMNTKYQQRMHDLQHQVGDEAEAEAEMNLLHDCRRHVMELLHASRDQNFLYMVMPYIEGGELFDGVITPGIFGARDIEHIKRLFGQMVKGFYFLHVGCGLAHRDPSLENCLVEMNGEDIEDITRVIVMDFGMLQRVPRNPHTLGPCLFRNVMMGKPYYFSLETFVGGRPINPFKQDIYALGMCLLIMMTKNAPFDTPASRRNFYTAVRDGNFTEILMWFKNVHDIGPGQEDELRSTLESLTGDDGDNVFDENFLDLIRRCLHPNQLERPSIEEILDHEWLAGYI